MSRFIFSNTATLNLSVADNILFSTFRGILTREILIESVEKWFFFTQNTEVNAVYADFSDALMQVSDNNLLLSKLEKEATNLEEIIFYTPIELFSRILIKDFIQEHEHYFRLKQLKTRVINTENAKNLWKHRQNLIFSD